MPRSNLLAQVGPLPAAFWCRQAPVKIGKSPQAGLAWKSEYIDDDFSRKNSPFTGTKQLACLRLSYTEYSHDGDETYKSQMVH